MRTRPSPHERDSDSGTRQNSGHGSNREDGHLGVEKLECEPRTDGDVGERYSGVSIGTVVIRSNHGEGEAFESACTLEDDSNHDQEREGIRVG